MSDIKVQVEDEVSSEIRHFTVRPSMGALCRTKNEALTPYLNKTTCWSCLEAARDIVIEYCYTKVQVEEYSKKVPDGMRSGEGGREEFVFSVEGRVSDQARTVFNMLPKWLGQFNRKNQDYTNSGGAVSDNFGILGQYMKLVDKVHKLRKPMWDGEIVRQAMSLGHVTKRAEELNYEDAQEILDDVIGHALLAKLYLQERNT